MENRILLLPQKLLNGISLLVSAIQQNRVLKEKKVKKVMDNCQVLVVIAKTVVDHGASTFIKKRGWSPLKLQKLSCCAGCSQRLLTRSTKISFLGMLGFEAFFHSLLAIASI